MSERDLLGLNGRLKEELRGLGIMVHHFYGFALYSFSPHLVTCVRLPR